MSKIKVRIANYCEECKTKYRGLGKHACEQKANRKEYETSYGLIDGPSKETLLMIQMATDMGYTAYWAGDRAVFGDLPDHEYERIQNLITVYGWKKGGKGQ
jgi:hypothetical protein